MNIDVALVKSLDKSRSFVLSMFGSAKLGTIGLIPSFGDEWLVAFWTNKTVSHSSTASTQYMIQPKMKQGTIMGNKRIKRTLFQTFIVLSPSSFHLLDPSIGNLDKDIHSLHSHRNHAHTALHN